MSRDNKKLLTVLLVAAVLVQLAFPIGGIIYKKAYDRSFEKHGEIYKIKLYSLSYQSLGDSGALIYNIPGGTDEIFGKRYMSLTTGSDGFAEYEFSSKRPSGDNYIEGEKRHLYFQLPYEASEIEVSLFEKLIIVNFTDIEGQFSIDGGGYIDVGAKEIYLEAKVYKGRFMPIACYVDGVNAEEILSFYNDNFDRLYKDYIGG